MDITMCNGGNCPNKESCYRYTAIPNTYWQSYFIGYPEHEVEGDKVDCKMFIDINKHE